MCTFVYTCVCALICDYECTHLCSSTARRAACVSNAVVSFRSNSTILVLSYEELTSVFVRPYKVPEVSTGDFSRSF